jgi:hypothetical protein
MTVNDQAMDEQRGFSASQGRQYSLLASPAHAVLMAARILMLALLSGTLSSCVTTLSQAQTGAPESILLTWMSVTNWLFEVGDTRIVTDGYLTRISPESFSEPSFATTMPSHPDEPAIRRVIAALGESGHIDFILTGHSHFDHAFDTVVWAKLTGARIVGARSTCLQAVAQGVPSAQCTAVEGGEVLSLGDHVTVRVVRWNHSGEVSTPAGRLLSAPLELVKSPTVPAGARGLRPGVWQDFPNRDGARAYLFTVRAAAGGVSWLYSNTGNADTFQQPAAVDEAFFPAQGFSLENLVLAPQPTSPHDNLRAALTAAGLEQVDLWIGYSDRRLAETMGRVVRPRAHIPQHWDGLFTPFFAGVPFSYATVAGADDATTFFQAQGIRGTPNLVKFRDDHDAMLVMSLEQYDEITGTATKAAIMEKDVVGHYRRPSDALVRL